jgi:sec-independent protein translocase protein TatA
MGELRPWHIIVLLAVIFVLFGYKKLPDATRSLGRSLRILKTEVKSLHDDEPVTASEQQPAAPRAVEAPRAAVPEASSPASPPVSAGTPAVPTTPTSDADHR